MEDDTANEGRQSTYRNEEKTDEEMNAMRAEKETLFAQRTHDLTEALKEAEAASETLDSQIRI